MQHFLIRRGLYVLLMLVLVSIVGFVVINLPRIGIDPYKR